jgi:hypothetical protein
MNRRMIAHTTLIGAIAALLACGTTGCFTARTYQAETGAQEVRVFDRYIISLYVGNRTAATYDYSRNDFTYLLGAGIKADSGRIDSNSTLECRLSNLCISGVCLAQVYCPPCAQDTAILRFGPYLSYYNCGSAKIPKECQELMISFDAILLDTAADKTLATRHVQMTLGRNEWKIPAILPI